MDEAGAVHLMRMKFECRKLWNNETEIIAFEMLSGFVGDIPHHHHRRRHNQYLENCFSRRAEWRE